MHFYIRHIVYTMSWATGEIGVQIEAEAKTCVLTASGLSPGSIQPPMERYRGCIARDRAVRTLDYIHLRLVTAAIPLLTTRVHTQELN